MIATVNLAGALSTRDIDNLFAAVHDMPTCDRFGKVCHKLTAEMWEACANAWRQRDLSFADGKSMMRECLYKSATHWRLYADKLESIARIEARQ